MKTESIVFAIAGMCFGLILGWVIAVQQNAPVAPAAPAETPAAQSAAPALDEARVQALTTILNGDPNNGDAALQLANMYYDAQRFPDAITWYEKALSIQPRNPDISTDLGISYYYVGQVDKALQQFEQSLTFDPNHLKTMLNQGIVLAFGKEDIDGAAVAWKKVVAIAPTSPEGQRAQSMLDGLTAAGHGATPAAAPGS